MVETSNLRARLKRSPTAVRMRRSVRDAMIWVRRGTGAFAMPFASADYLRRHPVRKLQIGAGTNPMPGWLNTDAYPGNFRVLPLDTRRRFPFADGAFDYVFSEHHIE